MHNSSGLVKLCFLAVRRTASFFTYLDVFLFGWCCLLTYKCQLSQCLLCARYAVISWKRKFLFFLNLFLSFTWHLHKYFSKLTGNFVSSIPLRIFLSHLKGQNLTLWSTVGKSTTHPWAVVTHSFSRSTECPPGGISPTGGWLHTATNMFPKAFSRLWGPFALELLGAILSLHSGLYSQFPYT